MTVRSRWSSRIMLMAGAVLVGTAFVGCGPRPAADATATPAQRPSDNPNVLERHEMNPSATTFFELIQGRLPGVVIRQRGGNLSVEIRGQSSIRGGSEALILIDGVENPSRALSGINPSDIERVEVVKDGAAAMYGVRGANGVLLITTRRR